MTGEGFPSRDLSRVRDVEVEMWPLRRSQASWTAVTACQVPLSRQASFCWGLCPPSCSSPAFQKGRLFLKNYVSVAFPAEPMAAWSDPYPDH